MTTSEVWQLDNIMAQIEQRYKDEGLDIYFMAEKPAVERAITSIAGALPNNRYVPKGVLGIGGSGIVLRLADARFPRIDRALKFPRPIEGKVSLIVEMLKKEISHLADLRHPGIVRILQYETLASIEHYVSLPFYLMEFVDGAPSQEFVRRDDFNEVSFRSLVRRTAETIAYLHEGDIRSRQGFAHLDLKAENLLVTADGTPVLIDLGTCKRLVRDEDLTIVACTRSNAHPELMRFLTEDPTDNNRAKGEIKRSEINPQWDLWAFGLTMLQWLGVDRDDGKVASKAIYSRLNQYTRKYYMLLIARLLSYSPRSWLIESVGLSKQFLEEFPITDAECLCDLLCRLDGKSPMQTIDELNTPTSGTFQAAPGQHVHMTSSLADAVDHPLFKRLNSISQLGVVCQVYPGARHVRRDHCIGTYANTGQILRALYDDSFSPFFRQIITKEDCQAVLLAALFHDLGQFPLAHDLEEIDSQIFDHGELTKAMLKGKWARKKKGSTEISFPSLEQVFMTWGTSSDRILSILGAKPILAGASRKDKLLRSILSGPIDGDKLNYLLRDASLTGVPDPLGIDIDRILRCMTVVVMDDPAARDVPMIGIHSKGRVAAEFLILARYAMFSQVYWHHAVRAQKAMLSRAVSALLSQLSAPDALEEFKSDFLQMVISLPQALYETQAKPIQVSLYPELQEEKRQRFGTLDTATNLAITDAAVLCWFREELRVRKRPEWSLIEGILSRNLFKRLWVVSFDMERERWETLVELWSLLDRSERHDAFLSFERSVANEILPDKAKPVTALKSSEGIKIVRDKVGAEIPWLLVDIPGERAGSEVGLYHVLEGQRRQLRKNDRAVGVSRPCGVWKEYAHDLRKAAGKIRIFCDPTLADMVEATVSFERGISLLEDAFREHAR